MSIRLEEGLQLRSVWWAEGEWKVGQEYAGAQSMVESITVRMQKGQMSMVPWAELKFTDNTALLVNCALLEGCEVLKDE